MLAKLRINKQYLLLAGAILLLVVAWQFAFRRTAEAWQLHAQLQKKIQKANVVSYQPDYLERKNHNIDKILQLYKADTINLRSNVLSNITSIALQEDVKLSDVPLKDPSLNAANRIVEKLTFEGDYFALEKTLSKLQSTANLGVIRSVSIKSAKQKNESGKTGKTMMDIYLEVATN